MAFSYDLLPPIIPDFIQPIANTEQFFQIPITMAEITGEENDLTDFGIKTVQYYLIDQNNNIDQSFEKIVAGEQVIKKETDKNEFILSIPALDSSDNTNFKMNDDVFYKLQIRFSRQSFNQLKEGPINPNCFSEWSSICLLKKVSIPTIKIYYGDNLLTQNHINTIEMDVISGIFSFTKNNNMIQKYKIMINKDDTNEIIYNTDWLVPTEKNKFVHRLTNHILKKSEKYTIYLLYQTSSGYEGSAHGKINIFQGILDEDFFEIQEQVKSELGEIWVGIIAQNNVNQNFLIQRSSSLDGFSQWEDVAIVQFKGGQFNGSQQIVAVYDANNNLLEGNWEQLIWQDKTIKSGVFYQYAVSTFYKKTNSLDTKTLLDIGTTPIYTTGNTKFTEKKCCIFEDMFLVGNSGKSLRIKYNPTLTNFKYNIQESIQNTLGSQYPFITRSGKNNYRSFTIGGLITLFMDINDRANVPFYWTDSMTVEKSSITNVSTIIYLNKAQTMQRSLFLSLKLGPNDSQTNLISIEDLDTKDLKTLISLIFDDEEQTSQLNYLDSLKTAAEQKEYRKFLKTFYNQRQDKTNQVQLNNFVLEKDLFSSDAYLLRQQYNQKNNITKYNDIIYEREFRENVYNFLYSNTPKLFKSNPQGNILVRLTNLSFTPMDQLGRKLYSFSADAIEIGPNTIDNLFKYNIYDKGEWKNPATIISQEFNVKLPWAKEDIFLNDQLKKNTQFNLINSEIVNLKNCQIKVDVKGSSKLPLVDLSSMSYVTSNISSSNKQIAPGFLLEVYTNNNGIGKISKIFINFNKEYHFPQNTEITRFAILKPSDFAAKTINISKVSFNISGVVSSMNYTELKKTVQTSLFNNFAIRTVKLNINGVSDADGNFFEDPAYLKKLQDFRSIYPEFFKNNNVSTEPISLFVSINENNSNKSTYKGAIYNNSEPQILFRTNKDGNVLEHFTVKFNELYSLQKHYQEGMTIKYRGILTNPNINSLCGTVPASNLYNNKKLFKNVPLTITYTFKIHYTQQKNKIFI